MGRVAARKHFSTQQARDARTSDGTRAPGVGRTAAGVLQAVTGPRQLMRQRSRYDRAIQSIPPRWARRVCLRGRRPKVHRAREKRKTHRATGHPTVQPLVQGVWPAVASHSRSWLRHGRPPARPAPHPARRRGGREGAARPPRGGVAPGHTPGRPGTHPPPGARGGVGGRRPTARPRGGAGLGRGDLEETLETLWFQQRFARVSAARVPYPLLYLRGIPPPRTSGSSAFRKPGHFPSTPRNPSKMAGHSVFAQNQGFR